ncbi:aminotransferase [Pseudooceanicola sp. HF7]|uniref:aminotransferase n=1 Tax=Pseudooceanicola sp. HF7 TaxID=2721560 RepID=UPI00143185FD|nr:aminotransferase [Pseudooceanicola sp. HF7]NIZ09531.1 aminotransferase [Pseudooceanicola sp. HF7]
MTASADDLKNAPVQNGQLVRPWQDVTSFGQDDATVLENSSGIYVRDSEGNDLIDGPGGMWCVNVGHGRREIIEAVSKQLEELPYFSPWTMSAPMTTKLAERIASISPGDLNNIFFTTGGSTAVDSALRFVFFYNNCLGRPEKKQIIARVNGYHGSTYLSSSVSGKKSEKAHMDMAKGLTNFISSPKPKDRPKGMSVEDFCDTLIAELEAKIEEVGADKIGAFIAEPVMGSGGVVVAPDGYFKRCYEVCKKHDILFISDEVVTSFGRLGHYFASEDVFGVVPDMITTAKGMTSGYLPMGALLISDRLIADINATTNEYRAFTSGFTYSGHPASAACAMANIDIFERDGLLEHVREIAPYFAKAMNSLSDLPVVTDVRVLGLMAGVECELDADTPDEDRDCAFTAKVDVACQELGLLVRPIYNSCVMSPPLTITKEQIDEMVAILRAGIIQAAENT